MRDGSSEKTAPHPRGEELHYFESAAAETIGLTRCSACGEHFLPRVLCPRCWSEDVQPVRVAGRGTIYAFTVLHRGPSPGFMPDAPYVVALVELEERVRLLTNIVDVDPGSVEIGMAVHAVFERRGDLVVPLFAPAAA